MTSITEPLFEGLKILDFTRALAGPTCTRLFAEMGADVIKVESAPDGELARKMSKIRNERSLYYIQQNLGKQSFCVNLRGPRGVELVKELVPHMDVVVENFKPGRMASMGLGYDVLKELKEDIILCSISAMGQTGPLSEKPGYDYIAQAYAGVTSMIGDPDDAPSIPLLGIGDASTGVHASFAVLAAIYHRDRTGRGQHLDVALLDAYYHCHEVNVHQYSGSYGEMKPTRGGRHMSYVCPGGVYRGNGGDIMIMAFLHHWKDLCAAMDRTDLIDKEGWANDLDRLARLDEVISLVETWLQTFPSHEDAIAKMEEHGVPVAPILTIEETVNHPHHRHRGTIRTINDRIAGEFDIPGMPIKFSEFPDDLELEAATLGEHNQAIVTDLLGHSEEEVAQMRADGLLTEGKF
jgi:crotonobetainyl-CoA:carnitine CoA-transferase CaiB-like acyl-CoA transferase